MTNLVPDTRLADLERENADYRALFELGWSRMGGRLDRAGRELLLGTLGARDRFERRTPMTDWRHPMTDPSNPPGWDDLDAMVERDPLQLRDVAAGLATRLANVLAGVEQAMVLLRRSAETTGQGLTALRCLEQAVGAAPHRVGEPGLVTREDVTE